MKLSVTCSPEIGQTLVNCLTGCMHLLERVVLTIKSQYIPCRLRLRCNDLSPIQLCANRDFFLVWFIRINVSVGGRLSQFLFYACVCVTEHCGLL